MLLIGIAPQFSYLKSGVTEAWEQGEFEADSHKVQASGYEISKYWGYNSQHDKHNWHRYTSYMKVKRVNPKISYHKEKIIFSISLIFLYR